MKKSLLFVCSLFILLQVVAPVFAQTTLSVNATDDLNDGDCNVTHCSLREAINAANLTVGKDTISFSISGSGVQTIQPNSPLPTLTESVIIDGTTQPGYIDAPLIELDGTNAGSANGLTLMGGSSTVKGLVINRFTQSGIQLTTLGSNTILSNYIGTDSTGTLMRGNLYGIEIRDASNSNTVGGSPVTARNLISGNTGGGLIIGPNASNSRVYQNYIGSDITGQFPIPNNRGVVIQGNNDSNGNWIGLLPASPGNLIAFNQTAGILITGGIGNRIDNNQMFANDGPGIDLSQTTTPDLVTPNDVNDADTGPNDLINFPVISSASLVGSRLIINATLDSVPSTGFNISRYFSAECDPSGHGEGQKMFNNMGVSTNSSGHANITFNSTMPAGVPGLFITLTATASAIGSSEFSACVPITNITPTILTVNVADDSDSTVCDATHCSLREAITEANIFPDTNTILFNIPGDGVRTIYPVSPLPAATSPIILDGTSQPGYSGQPLIGLNGMGAGASARGLSIKGGNSVVKGFIINTFSGAGIVLENGSGTTVSGNYIGTGLDATDAQPNGDGIAILNSANNIIGGTDAAARNIIDGNSDDGISLDGASTTGNIISGNTLGVDRFNRALPNAGDGIEIVNGASNNIIGGTVAGSGNLIAFNTGRGVRIASGSTGNRIWQNKIYRNGGIAIDLNGDGPTLNDIGDLDSGGNNRQNFPSLNTFYTDGTKGYANGTLDSSANLTYHLEFFRAECTFPALIPEAHMYLGTADVTTDESGHAVIAAQFVSASPLFIDALVTVTVTDPAGNTSEMSPCISVSELPQAGPTFTVTNADDSDDGLCGAIDCNLREAITAANVNGDTNTIAFNIVGGAGQTIYPMSELPAITSPVIVDGTTQPGYSETAKIGLNGSIVGINADGLTITAGNSTVKGLAIYSFSRAGIWIQDAGGNTISGNFIGTYLSGNIAAGNSVAGIVIDNAPNNMIGGINTDTRNVIVGSQSGITIQGTSAQGNTVQGNYIGTNASGMAALGNTHFGIDIAGFASNNALINNLVSGNNPSAGALSGAGIQLVSSNNVLKGNKIGTDASGTLALGNGFAGILVNSAMNNEIGGTGAAESNLIAFNNGYGIYIRYSPGAAIGNRIRGNSIFSNNDLGIDLSNFVDGPSPNDPGDGDNGANKLQNFPVLNTASIIGSNLTVNGTLNSTANTIFQLDFFANPSCDSSGYGEGQNYLGSTSATTNAGGNATFTASFVVGSGQTVVSATATDANGNTSEFSVCKQITEGPQSGPTFTVNTTSDADDGICGALHCSLREAINAANTTPNLNTINFAIGGSGTRTIQPLGPLPPVTDPVIIDGTSQPDFAGMPLIELDGSAMSVATGFSHGLVISAGNSTVKGLIINRFKENGIILETNGSNIIQGNYIGVDASGTQARGNGDPMMPFNGGYGIIASSSGNTIGGTTPQTRNVISANFQAGIMLLGSNNYVRGNYIGTNASGTVGLANKIGIDVAGNGNFIGGTSPQSGNIISGNVIGMIISRSNNVVQGNYIGVDASGTAPLGNTIIGIDISGDVTNLANNNLIGGTENGAGNIIAYSGSPGIGIRGIPGTSVGNSILGNRIFANGTLGIDLLPENLTPNDSGDGDTGPNNLQNYPVLSNAGLFNNSLIIDGTLNSVLNGSFRVEFFSNLTCDASGNGEGQTYLGYATVLTSISGNISFTTPFATVSEGHFITATATDASGNTSEFSTCVPVLVVSPPAAAPSINYFINLTITLTWRQISWAAGYQIQVDDQSDFMTLVYQNSDIAPSELSETFTLLTDGDYYWRVRAVHPDGKLGDWSSITPFRVSLP